MTGGVAVPPPVVPVVPTPVVPVFPPVVPVVPPPVIPPIPPVAPFPPVFPPVVGGVNVPLLPVPPVLPFVPVPPVFPPIPPPIPPDVPGEDLEHSFFGKHNVPAYVPPPPSIGHRYLPPTGSHVPSFSSQVVHTQSLLSFASAPPQLTGGEPSGLQEQVLSFFIFSGGQASASHASVHAFFSAVGLAILLQHTKHAL